MILQKQESKGSEGLSRKGEVRIERERQMQDRKETERTGHEMKRNVKKWIEQERKGQ